MKVKTGHQSHSPSFWGHSQTSEPPSTCSCCAGGYLQYIFRTAARELFGIDVPWSEPLPLKVLRNADFQEVTLERDGCAVLRFALAYGFRNIQTIVSLALMKISYTTLQASPPHNVSGRQLFCVEALMPVLITASLVAHHRRFC